METQQAAHPAPRTLAAFALNRLPAEARERLQTHLRSCASCSDFVARTPQQELQALLGSVERSRAEQSTPGERNRDTIRSPDPPVRAQTSTGVRPPNPAMPAATPEAIPSALREQLKYRVVRLLGRGGMGSVYEARHERMDRRVAIKVINPELVGNPQAVDRFNAEVQAVSKLDHANIARAYDAETFGTLQAIIMEFVEGQTLYDFMKARQRAGGQLSVTDACRLIRQTLLGLQHAHERGIAHRDLKPQNLMLTRDKGIVKILDFGLAKLTNDRRGLTKTNVTMGTYEYLAPEQALDAATAGPRADIYSLGCTLYYLLADVLPFAYDTDVKLLLAHQNEISRPLVEVRPDVPQEVSDLVARMLAKDPADRPQTAAEAAQIFLLYAKGEIPAPATPAAAELAGAAGAEPGVEPALAALFSEIAHGTRPTTGHAEQKVSHRPSALETPLGEKQLAAVARRYWPVAAIASAALLGGIILFGGLFKVRMAEGTIALRVNAPNAEVSVDGQTITVQWGDDGKTAEITAPPGKHRVEVKKQGFVVSGTDVTLNDGGHEILSVALESAAKQWPPQVAKPDFASDGQKSGPPYDSAASDEPSTARPQEAKAGGDASVGPGEANRQPSQESPPAEQPSTAARAAGLGDGATKEAPGRIEPETVFLDDLDEQNVTVGFGGLGKHGATGYPESDQEPQVLLDGQRVKHALSMHPREMSSARVSYALNGKYVSFAAVAAVMDGPRYSGSPLQFRVLGDSKILWTSSAGLQRPGERERCGIPIHGVTLLTLEVVCSGASHGAHAVWIDPSVSTQPLRPSSSGLATPRASVAPADVQFPLGQWVDVLRFVDTNSKMVVAGDWSRRGQEIAVEPGGSSRIAIPVVINGGYDLEVELTRASGNAPTWTRISVRSHSCEVILSGMSGQVSGLNMVDGLFLRDPKAPIAVRPGEIKNGRRYRLLISARTGSGGHASLDVSLDGKRYLPRWTGDPASLNEMPERSLPNPKGLGLGADGSAITFHTVRLRMVSGSASLDPALVSENRSPEAAPASDAPADPGHDDATPPSVRATSEPRADPVQAHTIWTGDNGEKLTILERNKEKFKAILHVGDKVELSLSGKVGSGHISWQARDVIPIKGGRGNDCVGTIEDDTLTFHLSALGGATVLRLQRDPP